jgi:TPR repeat protein
MRKVKASRRLGHQKLSEMFIHADRERDRGRTRSAFRISLAAAKAGDAASQLAVGYCYDEGKGVLPNRSAALYWYGRAYRHGDASAANNIGTIWRDRGDSERALSWFRRAVKLGNDESNLEIAKYYLHGKRNPKKAIIHLEKVRRSEMVSEASAEEAKRLLREAEAVK